MPTISRFYGISIFMYRDDHNWPHFHAHYSGQWAAFDIHDLLMIGDKFPPRAQRLVRKWGRLHRTELLDNWNLVRQKLPLNRIPGLD